MRTSDVPVPGPAALRVLGAALLLATGCGGPTVAFAPVEGTVTRHGRPVARAQVIFYAEAENGGPRAIGITDDAGRFRLAADDGRTGAPVGRHRVCVIDTSVMTERLAGLAKRSGPAAAKAPPSPVAGKGVPLPPEYGRPGETPLRAEVRPGAQTIDFQIP
ncbi:MAG TPA: hypothetical protein VGE74_07175 [Gemmata sp.]